MEAAAIQEYSIVQHAMDNSVMIHWAGATNVQSGVLYNHSLHVCPFNRIGNLSMVLHSKVNLHTTPELCQQTCCTLACRHPHNFAFYRLAAEDNSLSMCTADIIGHVEVDFVALREEGKVRLWAVDLNICASSSLSSFQLFDFLAAGQLDPSSGTYWISAMPGLPNPLATQDPVTEQQLSSAAHTLEQSNVAGVDGQNQMHSLSKQASSQLADSEVQAALQQPQTNSGSHSQAATTHEYDNVDRKFAVNRIAVDKADRDGQAAMRDSIAESALQQGPASRHWTGDSDGGMPDQDTAGSHGGPAGTSADAGQAYSMVQSGAVAAVNGTEMWQAEPQDGAEQEMQLEPRYYTAIDILFHSGMLKHRSTQFLQSCRLAHLGFDMMGRQGLVLNFMDSLSSCCVGLQCAAPTPQAALQGLANVSHDRLSLKQCICDAMSFCKEYGAWHQGNQVLC